MKKLKFLIPLTILGAFSLSGCEASNWFSSVFGNSNEVADTDTSNDFSNDVLGEGATVEVEATPDEPVVENTGDFSLSTSDGTFGQVGSVYTITAAGTYKVSGVLEEGQILINAGENDEVVLELNGATISCSTDSPIKALEADKLEISAKKNTSNAIYDNRSVKTIDDDSQGAGAVYAKCDLKMKGAGTLVVKSSYNNGLHTTKDLTIQKETLYVYGYNNAIKGNDSVNITSGAVTAVAHTGNGIKSENTDQSSKGKQRGSININGGSVLIDSLEDAIEAAYDLIVNEANEDGVSTSITLKTGKYSQNSSSYNSNNSSKGLKAENNISVEAGSVVIQASDDSIHANYGTVFETGETGKGTISVSGGSISIASGDDGIHAAHTLSISGGEVLITNSYEGLEACHISISGGSSKVYATDDGVNAADKDSRVGETPSISVSGGTLDVSIAQGDTDGIDSNGSFTQTGGLIISRGSPNTASGMSTGLDCDGTASITGGTFIAFNGMEKQPSVSTGVVKAYYGSSSQGGGPGGGGPGGGGPGGRASYTSKFQSGTYTLSGGEFSKQFYNQFTYSTFIVYSSEMSTQTAYTLKNGDSTILSWTQTDQTQQIS